MHTIGAFGNTIIFLFTALGAWLFLLYFLSYLGRCFLVTLDGTAAGADEVTWPDEPLFDWMWKFLFLGWLICIWLFLLAVPGAMLAVILQLSLPAFCGIWLGLLWLVFPISLLSCLSGHSWMGLLQWPVIAGWLRNWPAVLWMYLVCGALTATAGGVIYLALSVQGSWWLLVLAAPLVAAVLLINARLLGRVAWLIGQKPTEAARRQQRRERNKPTKLRAHDPWAAEEEAVEVDLEPLPDEPPSPTSPQVTSLPIPEDPEDEWAAPKAYGLLEPGAKRQTPKPSERPWYVDEVEGYDFAAEKEPYLIPPVPLDGYRPIGDETEVDSRRRKPGKRSSPPKKVRLKWPLTQGVFTFPWYPASLSAWGYLSTLAFLHLVLAKTMVLWWPFG